MITDPVLATHVLRSKMFDKLRMMYAFLDPVRVSFMCIPRCYTACQIAVIPLRC